MRQLVASESGYLYLGRMLTHAATAQVFELQLEQADPRMATAFASAGGHWTTAEDLAKIGQHKSVAYLIGRGGSRKHAEDVMAAAGALLGAGGFAVKVESAGIAHSSTTWLELVAGRYLFSAHRAFVVYVTGSDVYSCGMHNLGLRDAIIQASAAAEPAELLRTFTYYLFTESPVVRAGQTFAAAEGKPVFVLEPEPCSLYDADPLFTNPYGMWRLRPRR